MAINVSQAFKRTSANPVDESLTLTKAQMLAINDNLQPNKYFAICLDDGELYIYDKSATPNAETGKFKKYGGGHAVEDSEGTALTQRDTMQFGDGFNASDDSENEKTVVEPNLMTAADMDDVVTPLPSVRSRYHKYSTEEQIVGEWIDGKPLYQKTYALSQAFLISAIDGAAFDLDIPKATTNVLMYNTYVYRTNMYSTYQGNSNNFPEDIWSVFSNINKGGEGAYNRLWLKLGSGFQSDNVESGMLTIQYTKTTD